MHVFQNPAARAFSYAGESARAFARARALMNVARIRRARGVDRDEIDCVVRNARAVVRAGRQFRAYAKEHGVEVPT